MRRCIEQSNNLALLSPFPSWLGCIINTSGYDFRKGQALEMTGDGAWNETRALRVDVPVAEAPLSVGEEALRYRYGSFKSKPGPDRPNWCAAFSHISFFMMLDRGSPNS